MAKRAMKLRKSLDSARRIVSASRSAYLRAEQSLVGIEEREGREARRSEADRLEIEERLLAVNPGAAVVSPRRTIAEARDLLETAVIPKVNDHWAREYRTILEAAEGQARKLATERVESDATEVAEASKNVQRELTEVRDGFEALTSDADSLTASEYSRRLAELRDRERRANDALRYLEERVGRIESIENDRSLFLSPRIKTSLWLQLRLQHVGEIDMTPPRRTGSCTPALRYACSGGGASRPEP